MSCATGGSSRSTRTQARGRPSPAETVSGPIAPKSSSAGSAASPREERDYREIYTLYSKGAYEAALQKLQSFERVYPRSPLTAQIANLHGLAYLLTKRPALAISHFQRALAASGPSTAFKQYLLYNLADAQFESGQTQEAQKTASTIRTDAMDRENRVKVHYLLARVHTERGASAESARNCLAAGRLLMPNTSRDTRTAVSTLLDLNLKAMVDTVALEDLYRSYEDSPLADQVLYRLGSQEMASGNREKGEAHLRELQSRYPESVYFAQASEMVRTGGQVADAGAPFSLRDTGPVESRTVGVLLPMKGKFAKFGARSLQGIELAFRIFNAAEPDSKVTLVVEDSGEETETAIRALDRLIKQHHVIAVVGPLLSKGIDQVTARADELGVPLISLARHQGVESEYIFQAGLTLRMQAKEIARYAIEQLGMKRFAVVYPRDKVGEDSLQRFWDSVEQLGGTITGVESYNPGETDFRQAVDRLSGLYYSDARSRELEDLAKERQLNNIKKRTRKTERYFSLKPIVDFDAVFIPEEPKVAGQILPTFAYRDVDGVKFLGTSVWNSPEFPARAQGYSERSLFPDAFFPQSESANVRKYAAKFRATFNQEPTSMDAMAYDAAHVLESVLSHEAIQGRSDLKDRLKEVRNFPGVTGRISYEDGQFARDLKILTAKGGQIVEVPTPTSRD